MPRSIIRKFKCTYCNKLTLHNKRKFMGENGKLNGRLCKSCSIEDDAAWDWYHQQQEIEKHQDDILHGFCGVYGCWRHADFSTGLCLEHDDSDESFSDHDYMSLGNPDDNYDLDVPEDYHDEDEYVSSMQIYHRAYSHFGNHEQAREAAEMYPGDFV